MKLFSQTRGHEGTMYKSTDFNHLATVVECVTSGTRYVADTNLFIIYLISFNVRQS
jgi:hypothetical protein